MARFSRILLEGSVTTVTPDGDDLVAARPADEPVGGLRVGGLEEAVGEHDRGPAHPGNHTASAVARRMQRRRAGGPRRSRAHWHGHAHDPQPA